MGETTYTFRVEGMHCGSCGMLVDDTLEELDGVFSTRTSVRAATSTVRADPQRCLPEDVVAAIAELGYQASLNP